MAMTTCGECRKPVSTEAAACPNCGAPPARFVAPKTVQNRRLTTIVAGGLVLVAAVATWSSRDQAEHSPASPARLVTPPNAPAPTADQGTPASLQPTPAADPPATPQAPLHNYTFEQDGEYGYEPVVSDDDRRAGQGVKPMLMVRYLGDSGGKRRFASVENNMRTVFSCSDPCEVVRSTVYFEGQQVRQDTMRVAPGTIVSAVLEDIENGQLAAYGAK